MDFCFYQVANAEILAKLYIDRYDYRSAAGVYAALASRRSGVGETVVDLSERAAAFQCAVLQVGLLLIVGLGRAYGMRLKFRLEVSVCA